jgi:large subunit ribosomal protein L21
MYAIVQTGGKQYKVETGDYVKVEKLDGEPGTEVELYQVLAVSTPDGIDLGTPFVKDASVKATILRTARHRKIVVFKKKRRKAFQKKQGHRQWYSLLRIDDFQAPSVKKKPQKATEDTQKEAAASGETSDKKPKKKPAAESGTSPEKKKEKE